MMTLKECAKFDKDTGARERLTGWGQVCKIRAGENSKSQRRKRGSKSVRKLD
jgi:hypothetical protein